MHRVLCKSKLIKQLMIAVDRSAVIHHEELINIVRDSVISRIYLGLCFTASCRHESFVMSSGALPS